MKRRVFLLDIIRIVFALLVFARHSISMYRCVWFSANINTIITSLTGAIMTCFFVMSGFSIRMSSVGKRLNDGKEILGFYKKRLLTILPTYYLLNICYAFIVDGQTQDALRLLPIQLVGISAPFRSLFGIFVTGGTWFVSCILIAYFVYPLLHQILTQLNWRKKLLIVVALVFLRYYSARIDVIYKLESNYANPFFRGMDFAIGVFLYDLLAYEFAGWQKKTLLGISSGILILAAAYCLRGRTAAIVPLAGRYVPVMVMFACVLFISLNVRCAFLERSKVLSYLSKLTYSFYLMHMLAWKLSDVLFAPQISRMRIVYSLCISVVLAVIGERVTWLVQKLLTRKKEKAIPAPANEA